MNTDALLLRLEELERVNRALRVQLGERTALRQANANPSIADHDQSQSSLRAGEERFRQVADNLPALIAYVDADERYRFNNRAYETWVGRAPESLYGVHIREAIGEQAYERVKTYVKAALAGRRTGHEWWAPFPGGLRYTKSEYIPDRRSDGSIAGFYVLASDLTDFKRSQAALAESEARLRLAIDAGRMAIWEVDAATETVATSPELNRLLGFPQSASPTTEEIRSRYYPGERERLRKLAMETLARGERYAESELRIVWPDGSLRWLLLRAELIVGPDGAPTRTVGVALDITSRKKAEEHQQLLINELNHRVKNTLATVQSIATQSLRSADKAAEAREAVEGRLFALSRAHDVLTRENWDGAYLRELVNQAIAPFQGSEGSRFQIHGPDVRLPPRMALAIAMAIQELGTNAVKYGALSNESGRIAMTWTLAHRADEPQLELHWQESGGPPVRVPEHKGFGTRLIGRSLAQELNGDVQISFAPTGVVCSIVAPLMETADRTDAVPAE